MSHMMCLNQCWSCPVSLLISKENARIGSHDLHRQLNDLHSMEFWHEPPLFATTLKHKNRFDHFVTFFFHTTFFQTPNSINWHDLLWYWNWNDFIISNIDEKWSEKSCTVKWLLRNLTLESVVRTCSLLSQTNVVNAVFERHSHFQHLRIFSALV